MMRVKRVEQIRVQQAEIELKSIGVRSKVPIFTCEEVLGKEKEEENGNRR